MITLGKSLFAHFDTIFGSLLEVWYDGLVPQVNKPLPELCY